MRTKEIAYGKPGLEQTFFFFLLSLYKEGDPYSNGKDPVFIFASTAIIETSNSIKAIESRNMAHSWLASIVLLQKSNRRSTLCARFRAYHWCTTVIKSRSISQFAEKDQTNHKPYQELLRSPFEHCAPDSSLHHYQDDKATSEKAFSNWIAKTSLSSLKSKEWLLSSSRMTKLSKWLAML